MSEDKMTAERSKCCGSDMREVWIGESVIPRYNCSQCGQPCEAAMDKVGHGMFTYPCKTPRSKHRAAETQQPSAGSDEEWARSNAVPIYQRWAAQSERPDGTDPTYLEQGILAGLAEGRRREREDGVAQRLASDALATISGLRGSTPAEGYLKAPFLLSSDIERLVAEREQAAAREAWDAGRAAEYGAMVHGAMNTFDDWWKQRGKK